MSLPKEFQTYKYETIVDIKSVYFENITWNPEKYIDLSSWKIVAFRPPKCEEYYLEATPHYHGKFNHINKQLLPLGIDEPRLILKPLIMPKSIVD